MGSSILGISLELLQEQCNRLVNVAGIVFLDCITQRRIAQHCVDSGVINRGSSDCLARCRARDCLVLCGASDCLVLCGASDCLVLCGASDCLVLCGASDCLVLC